MIYFIYFPTETEIFEVICTKM